MNFSEDSVVKLAFSSCDGSHYLLSRTRRQALVALLVLISLFLRPLLHHIRATGQ